MLVPGGAKIVSRGQSPLLYEREPGGFRAFQSLASRRYGETAKLRQAQRRAITAFLAGMGLR